MLHSRIRSSRPGACPQDLIAFYGAGYQIHAENLAADLAGRERGDNKARWDELTPPDQDLAANIG
jgi:hypothetical protein